MLTDRQFMLAAWIAHVIGLAILWATAGWQFTVFGFAASAILTLGAIAYRLEAILNTLKQATDRTHRDEGLSDG